MKISNFFFFLGNLLVCLYLDPDSQSGSANPFEYESNPDPDPKHWFLSIFRPIFLVLLLARNICCGICCGCFTVCLIIRLLFHRFEDQGLLDNDAAFRILPTRGV